MRIAQVAPLYESVPPLLYGGTERVVSYLTEELVAAGHEVTLFASGDSRTSARLCPGSERSLRLDARCSDSLAHHILLLDRVVREAASFDLIHFHVDYLHFPLSRAFRLPQVTTLHGRLDLPDLQPLYREFADMPLVSISRSQRAPLPLARWAGTVYHGLPFDLLPPGRGEGGYLAFLGRISPEKRLDRAIRIAVESGHRLRVAAKVDKADLAYFESEIRPLLSNPLVEMVGEIGEREKAAFLGAAKALLFPVDWPEPFGLVMIESLACGTPVIGWRCGSVPEVLEEGVTGFVVDSHEQAMAAVERLGTLSRERCRKEFEEKFSARRMAANYLRVYESIVDDRRAGAGEGDRRKVGHRRRADLYPSQLAAG